MAAMLRQAQILFLDNHLLALNKPAGLLTQPSGSNEDSLEARAKAWIRSEYDKPGAVFLEAVHRIDRDVSGVVLFARTSKALSRMNEEVRRRNVTRVYHALTERCPRKGEQKLVHFLKHGSHRAVVTDNTDPDAREAILHCRTLKKVGDAWMIEIELETGRYHQIRAQLAVVNCPIIGDTKYGSTRSFPGGGIGLHHRRLEVQHPVRKEKLILDAPYPESWAADL